MTTHTPTRAVSPTSEGQATVEALFKRAHMVLPYPTTELQLTLQETHRHTQAARVRRALAPTPKANTSHAPAHGHGHCRTDMGLCAADPQCPNHQCPGHPGTQADPEELEVATTERDARLFRRILVGYAIALALCAAGAWQMFAR